MNEDLIGAIEVSTLLGISSERLSELAGEYVDFPQPRARLQQGHIWMVQDIERWISGHEGERLSHPVEDVGDVTARLSVRARRVVDLAEDESRELGHGWVGCEHLLIALASESVALPPTFDDLGQRDVRRTVRDWYEKREWRPHHPRIALPLTLTYFNILQRACVKAFALQHPYIQPEHLWLALAREEHSIGRHFLVDLGVDPAEVVTWAREHLGSGGS